MAKEAQNLQVMLLSGGIEFNCMENCIANGCHIATLLPSASKELHLTGMVFHETLCGSIFTANLLSMANPSHIVSTVKPHCI
jgi:hypothetical protein